LTSNGTIEITGAGTIAQYVRGDGTLETFPSLTGFVPYTGATQNVDLGEFGVDAGFVQLDTTPTNTPTTQGTIFWDVDDETVDVVLNGYIMKIGEDQFYPVKNQTGSSIAKGTAVRFAGTVGASGRLLIAPFIADGSVSSSFFMGVTAEAIANGADGKVLYFGRIRGINTNAFNEGDVLYASTTIAGGFQTAVPVAPNNIVQVAAVINKSINQGVIFIRPSFGSNINQDEGVKIVSPTTGQLLQLQANGLWENKTTAQVLGGTSSQFVKGDGSLDSNVYALNSALANYQLTSEKAQPNGYASLDSNGKVPLVQINDALIGNVNFQGLWNAATNTPTLANPPASGTKGHYYIVSTAGTFAGISFEVGDWIISDGTAWGKVDNTDAVSSVFGRTGNVTATNGDYNTSQVTENTNLYYTEARVNANTNVAANTAARHAAVTLGTANGLSLSTQQLSLGLASAGVTGALSGTDWSTFNSKQNALNGTGFVKISGTTISYDNSTYLTTAAAASTYLPLAGGTMTGNVNWGQTDRGITWAFNTDGASIKFYNTGDGDTNSRLEFATLDNNNEFFRWVHIAGSTYESMRLVPNSNGNAQLIVSGSIIKSGGTSSQFLKADGSVDSNAYITGNQTITLSGDATGSGTTAITVVLANSGVTAGTYNDSATQVRPFTVDTKGRITSIRTAVTITPNWGDISGQRTLARDDAGLQGNAGARSGFFQTESPVNYYTGATSWQHLIESRHTNDSNNYAMQIAGSFFDQEFYVRKTNNSATTGWSKLWHSGNITPVPTSRTITINGTTQDLSDNRIYNVGTVTSVAALTIGTSGTDLSSTVANGTTTPVITLNVPTASAANRGALSAADWTTFNNKQNALTNPVTGTGTTNYLPKFTGTSTIGNSLVFDNGTNLGIGTTSPFNSGSRNLDVNAAGGTSSYIVARANNNAGTVELAFDTDSGYVGTKSNHPLRIRTNDVTRLLISTNGNVSIGNSPTDAGFKLDVNGKIRSVNNNDQITIKTSSTNGTRIGHDASGLYFANDDTSLDVLRIFGGTSGSLRLSIASTGAATFSSSVTASGTGNIVIQAISSNNFPLFQLVDNRSGGAVWNIEGGRTLGNLQFRSNIFGDTVLELASSGAATFSSSVTSTGGFIMNPQVTSLFSTNGALSYYSTTNGVYLNGAGTNGWLRLNAAGTENDNTAINIYGTSFASAPGQIRLQTSSQARLTIMSGGNVLIGTTDNAGYKLDVNGTGRFSGELNVQYNNAISTMQGNTGFSVFRMYGGNGSSSNVVEFQIRNRVDGSDISSIGNFSNHDLQLRTNNVNRLTIAASTGAATFSSSVTAVNYVATGGNNTNVFNSASATTGWVQMAINNTGGSAFLGIENSTGNSLATGGSGYATILRNNTNTNLQFATNNIVRLTIEAAGRIVVNNDIQTGTNKIFTGTLDVNSDTRLAINFGNVLIGTTIDSFDKLRVDGTVYSNSIVTMRPASTTVKSDVWKLGRAALATNSDPYDRIIRVQIAGTLYDILAIDKGAA
jgi:hypothetical protein